MALLRSGPGRMDGSPGFEARTASLAVIDLLFNSNRAENYQVCFRITILNLRGWRDEKSFLHNWQV
jgi:hypothetical protein